MDKQYMFSVRTSDIKNCDGNFTEWFKMWGTDVKVVYSVHKIPYLSNGDLDLANMVYGTRTGLWLGTRYIVRDILNEVIWVGLNPVEMINKLMEEFI